MVDQTLWDFNVLSQFLKASEKGSCLHQSNRWGMRTGHRWGNSNLPSRFFAGANGSHSVMSSREPEQRKRQCTPCRTCGPKVIMLKLPLRKPTSAIEDATDIAIATETAAVENGTTVATGLVGRGNMSHHNVWWRTTRRRQICKDTPTKTE